MNIGQCRNRILNLGSGYRKGGRKGADTEIFFIFETRAEIRAVSKKHLLRKWKVFLTSTLALTMAGMLDFLFKMSQSRFEKEPKEPGADTDLTTEGAPILMARNLYNPLTCF